MSARAPQLAAHVVRSLEWLKRPGRARFRISINAERLRVVRDGHLVLGVVHSHAEARELIREQIAKTERSAA
jgi:hypothetical protein